MRCRYSSWLLTALLCVLMPGLARAEGSRELNATGGDRPHLLYRNRTQAGISLNSTIKVFAQETETILLGSSAAGIGSGTINYTAPDGTSGTCNADGFITDVSEETAGPVGSGSGGFDPCTVAVGSGQGGIWEIQFISPNPDAGGVGRPREPVGGTWDAQQNNDFFISAWDITVADSGGSFVNGRAYANYLPLRVSTGDTTKQLNSQLFVLTEDGYEYQVGFNNIEPQGFIFFANNKGFTTSGDNTPSFQSLKFEGADPGNPPAGFSFQNPENNDTTGTTNPDITHKLFFNLPDSSTEGAGAQQTPDGTTTWWLQTAQTPPDPQNLQFTGEEGTVGQAGTSPLTGSFSFDNPSSTNLSYTIAIDIDRNGIIEDNGQDVILVGTATPGSNTVAWDGLDGQGNTVAAGDLAYQIAGVLNGGEAHFPLIDVENNANGLIINRCDAGNRSSCSTVSSDVYFDDVTDTNLIGGSRDLAGVDSSGGAHAWSSDFGNVAGIDTWVNVPSNPFTLQDLITIAEADLQITKTVDNSTISVGQQLTYTITVTNAGPSSVTGAEIADTIPSELTSVTWTCAAETGSACGDASGSGNSINTTGDLANGTTLVYTVTGTVSSVGTGTIQNSASVTRPNDVTDPDLANNTASVPTTITEGADLEIVKTVSGTDNGSGYDITYTLVVTNNGTGDVTNATVTDTLDSQLTGLTVSCASTPASNCVSQSIDGSNNLSATVTLANGESATYTIVGQAADTVTGTLTNTAQVATPSGVTDPDTTNNESSASISLPLEADLSLTKDVTASVGATDTTLTYTITVTNNGPGDVTGATVTDTIPGDVTGVTWTCTASTGSSCGDASGSGNSISTTANLLNGGTATYTVTGTVANTFSGTVTNNASTSPPSGITDPDTSNNSDAETVTLPLEADLSLTKDVATSVGATDTTLTYTITVTNNGPSGVTGATVTDTIPGDITGVTWTCTPSTGSSCGDASGSGNSISTTADLLNGGTATYTVTGTVANSFNGTVTNNANTSPPSGITDPNTTNNSDAETVTLPVGTTDVTIAKTGASSFSLGADVSFTITVTNTGSSTALNVQVDDTTPTGLTFVSNSGDCTTVFVCDLSDIPAGETRTITTTFNVPSDYTGPDPITNTATVTLDNDADSTNNSATATVPLASTPSLILVKRITNITRGGASLTGVDFSSFNDDPNDTNDNTINDSTTLVPVGAYTVPSTTVVQSGDIVEYTVYFLSNGDTALTNAQICDAIPSGTTFVTNSFSTNSGIQHFDEATTTTTNFTNTTGDDDGDYFTPLTPVSSPCTPTNNPNGSVLVTFASLVANNGGYIRFRVQVN
ncbi:MAG: DUF11 domain-containing protein [Spirulina sp. SIO3F2]|nr:DUF11 domain-containing protein [Spirulina sp. SIO3F2]